MGLMLFVYFADASDSLSQAFGILSGVMFLASFVIGGPLSDGLDEKKFVRPFKVSLTIAITLTFLAILTPSEKTLYTMAAVKYGQDFLHNEKVNEIGEKALKVINKQLDKYIEEK